MDVHGLNDLRLHGKPFEMPTIEHTMQKLIACGCEKEKRLSGKSLVDFKEVRAAKQMIDGVIWGMRQEWGSSTYKI